MVKQHPLGERKHCRFCGHELGRAGGRCIKCDADQLPFYSPAWRINLAIVSAIMLPFAALEYQRRQTISETVQGSLKQQADELTDLTRFATAFSSAIEGLSKPCMLEDTDDKGRCDRELRTRWRAVDTQMYDLAWRIHSTPIGDQTYAAWLDARTEYWGEPGARFKILDAIVGRSTDSSEGVVVCTNIYAVDKSASAIASASLPVGKKTNKELCAAAVHDASEALEPFKKKIESVLCQLAHEAQINRLRTTASISADLAQSEYAGLRTSAKCKGMGVVLLEPPSRTPWQFIKIFILGPTTDTKISQFHSD